MEISVLCKVVDNFGDIGVAWRMVKQLELNLRRSEKQWARNAKINLIVDDLDAFNKINDLVDVSKNFQIVENIQIYYWKAEEFCYKEFSGKWEKLQIILECFQCGRPEWMEKILFDDGLEKTVNIIMIDYLTAEDYAEDFHKLQSLTRSAKVQKVNFMPGFTEKTGGLIIDDFWNKSIERNEKGPVLCFTYEGEWKGLLRGVEKAQKEIDKNLEFYVAQGRGKQSVLDASKNIKELKIKELPFVNQTEWDCFMKNCSVLFIRGEESMSRACLSGIPFVWHAYPQSDEYQLVKVKALLEKLRPYFESEDFSKIEDLWLLLNSEKSLITDEKLESAVYNFMILQDKLAEGFKNFSDKLRKNGDLTVNLMTFIDKNYII